MAGRGPAPKRRRARARDTREGSTLADRRTLRGPPLPKRPDGDDWLPETKVWYLTWRRSPQAERFTDTAWQRLRMLLPLVDTFFRTPSKDLLAEIRMNESKLGATPEDSQRLRWEIEQPAPPKDDPKPTSRSRSDPRRLAAVPNE